MPRRRGRRAQQGALVGNAEDVEQIRYARTQERTAEEQALADWQELLQLPAAQRRLREILSWCHPFQTSFDGSSPERMIYSEGERNIGLRLYATLEAADAERFYMTVVLNGVLEKRDPNVV